MDANVLFSALIADGLSTELLFSDSLELFAPQFIYSELAKHEDYICNKAHRSNADIYRLLELFRRRLRIVPDWKIRQFLKQAQGFSPDKNDAVYFAAALAIDAALWSNDKLLKKQDYVKVLSTSDLIQLLDTSV